jgi:hypothetical protein
MLIPAKGDLLVCNSELSKESFSTSLLEDPEEF